MLYFALKKPGTNAQTAPPTIPKAAISNNKSGDGSSLPQVIATKEAKMAPMVICPSAPMFQKRILKQGAMARAHPRSGMARLTVWRI